MSADSFDPTSHADPLQFWEQRIKASRWMITKTVVLGVFAGVMAVLGQGWLEHAAPLLPIISQNYSVWQLCYLLGLILIFVIWALAMRQKMALLENSKRGMHTQQRIAQHNARRQQAAEDIRKRRAEREKSLALELELALAAKRGSKSKSNKFDY